ncbi:MAG: hypothetical protein PUG68_06585 [Lachnospiraceae bacterium]|jgi:predicted HicB family RNase H-like nuclease|nr:hypothetical protein [Lachnospiraceae bacterium]MDD7327449.1 hypothetical protein [Lachnospiraceae bacterium]MDY2758573.1 hypothetical protein [Lachnospiraceae bacterium]
MEEKMDNSDIQEQTAPRRRGRPRVKNKKKQYTLTMRPDMYSLACDEAERRGISFSALIANALTEYMDRNALDDDTYSGDADD